MVKGSSTQVHEEVGFKKKKVVFKEGWPLKADHSRAGLSSPGTYLLRDFGRGVALLLQ